MEKVNYDKKKVIEIFIQSPQFKDILKKYKLFLTKKDIKNLLELSASDPESDFESMIIELLEKKFDLEKNSDNSFSPLDAQTYKEMIKEMGLARKRFYFLLNYIGKYVISRNIRKLMKKGKILEIPHDRIDKKHIVGLLKRKDATQKKVLLNPGPVLTSFGVKNALIQHDICHRDEDFENLLMELNKKSLKIFDADEDFSSIFISGSGTSAIEAAISSTIPKNKKILILSNGSFGERLKGIAQYHNLKILHIKKDWGKIFDIEEIEKCLESDPNIFALAMNHHETSTGILNPIHEIGSLCKKFDKIFIVDAVSSLGGEKLSVKKDNIDICISSANKCLHSISGISIICVNDKVWASIKDVKPRSYYLDLKKYYDYSHKLNQTPFTPSVSSLFALDRALEELLKEGLEVRRMKYLELNSILKLELSKLGFEFFTNYACQSHTILTVKVPEDIIFDKFYNLLKQKGFIVYRCKPPLKENYFQIANMGSLNKGIIYDFIFAIKDTLKKLRLKKKK